MKEAAIAEKKTRPVRIVGIKLERVALALSSLLLGLTSCFTLISQLIQSNSLNVPNIICFDTSLALRNKLGGVSVETERGGDIFSSFLFHSLQSKKLNESGIFRDLIVPDPTGKDIGLSWRVVAGQNPAYDQFHVSTNYSIGEKLEIILHEPVFQVRTLEGDRSEKAQDRVKRGKVPGTFHFSVLDNGVVSTKFWTIVDVSDDLSWGLFHYHGAARVAGQSYTGAGFLSLRWTISS
ncbi:Vitamin D3 receptor [Datura stramonium]|uniref:Vitamin D3 receptor n=1 Tax=Datura stramonium TaxID=4076 RepID=A0ABS8S0T7_DATST|nr:Vitamin D3 receptor [Datura stramonium]